MSKYISLRILHNSKFLVQYSKSSEPNKIQIIAEFDSEIYEKYILPRVRSMDAHDIINKIRK